MGTVNYNKQIKMNKQIEIHCKRKQRKYRMKNRKAKLHLKKIGIMLV